ncbi:MAG: porin family protein [Aquaticitalea sp.]
MQRICILTLFLSLSMAIGNAQDVKFGLKGGVNYSNASEENFVTTGITSCHLGGMMEALYDEKIAIQPEILYMVQGFDFTSRDTNLRSFKLSYVHVPFMLKYYVMDKFSIEAGPQIGFLSSAKIESDVPNDSVAGDVKDLMRSNELSLNIGVTLYAFDDLHVNARYSHGVTNAINQLSDENFKNRVLQFSIGYFF